jgi:hypothetical protein
LSSLWIFPIEIGLFGAEEMEVILLGVFIPFPNTPCKVGDPIVGGFALAVNIPSWSPDVPVSLGVIF